MKARWFEPLEQLPIPQGPSISAAASNEKLVNTALAFYTRHLGDLLLFIVSEALDFPHDRETGKWSFEDRSRMTARAVSSSGRD